MAKENNDADQDVGEAELLRRLAVNSGALARARVLLAGYDGALAEPNLEKRDSALASLVYELRLLISALDGKSVLYEDMRETPLSENEYIVPPELIKGGIHERIVNFLNDPKARTTSLSHSGLLLYGVSGTGKTEEVRHLMHCLRDNPKIRFVNGNISRILNSPAPGDAITGLYRDLQAQAEADDVKYVLLFDEFEGLVRQLLKKMRSVRTTTSDTATGPRRTHSRDEKSETNEAEVDKTGEEVLAALKSVLKGTGGIDRIFTIATSNSNEFEASLLTRLEAVEISPISMPFKTIGSDKHMLCQKYPVIIRRILGIMQAMHFRLHKQNNPVLSAISEELETLYSVINPEVEKIEKSQIYFPGRTEACIPENRQIAIARLWITELLKFFGMKLPEDETKASMWLRTNIRCERSIHDSKKLREAFNMTQQHIAKDIYLRDQDSYARIDSAKKQLALLLLPQAEQLISGKLDLGFGIFNQ